MHLVWFKYDHLSLLVWSKMELLVLGKQGLEPRLLPWQHHRVSLCNLSDLMTLMVPSLNGISQIFPEIFLIL